MATFPTTPYQTTLSAALDASAISLTTAASTGFVAGSYLVIGKEVLLLTKVDTTNHVHEVKRGMRGTAAVKHLSSAIVTLGAGSAFGLSTKPSGIEVAGYTGDYGTPALPIGSRWTDPDSGYEYLLVDTSAAFVVGEWVVITPAGAATPLAIDSKGRVGIVVEAPGSSDRLCWVIVVGSFASGLFTSNVTTGMQLGAGVGCATDYTCTNAVRIYGASCTTAPSTATSPTFGDGVGTAYLNNPWVNGVDEFVS